MSFKSVITVLVVVVSLSCVCLGTIVDLYEDENHQGFITTLEIMDDCHNLDPYHRGQVSSVNTHGDCVYLYDEKDCLQKDEDGSRIKVAPGTPDHNNLNAQNFNDATLSVGPCED